MRAIYLIRGGSRVGKCMLDIDQNGAFLYGVRVYKKYRGMGYCKYLVQKAISWVRRSWARQKQITTIRLHVAHHNISAIKCYQHNGFVVVRKNYDNGKLFGYTMERAI